MRDRLDRLPVAWLVVRALPGCGVTRITTSWPATWMPPSSGCWEGCPRSCNPPGTATDAAAPRAPEPRPGPGRERTVKYPLLLLTRSIRGPSAPCWAGLQVLTRRAALCYTAIDRHGAVKGICADSLAHPALQPVVARWRRPRPSRSVGLATRG